MFSWLKKAKKELFLQQYAHCADKNVLKEIWKAKIEKVIELNLSGKKISDLTPLKDLYNLQQLSVYSTYVSDLTPLKDLYNLQQLSVYSTYVSDLTPLKGLSNLQQLNLSKTQVGDLTPLKGLVNLQQLYVSSTQVSDLTPLKDLSNLQQLSVSSTQVSDLTPLKDLSNLQQLYISSLQVSDLDPLKNLAKLQKLFVFSTQVSDLSPLKNLAKLQKLSVHSTQVRDLRPLKELANLQQLYVQMTQISDLTPLKGLTNLQQLFISNTQVSDLIPLKGLANLQELYVQMTRVSDLTPLKDLYNLQQLSVYSTYVSDLTPLKDLYNLQQLNLSTTQVRDLTPLKDLTNLQILNLSKTQVSNLIPLKDLFNLQLLNLSSTQVSDLTPLKDLTNLQILNLSSTQVSDLTPLRKLIEKEKLVSKSGLSGGIRVEDCPLSTPPTDIINQGSEAILRYFQEQERAGTYILNTARLLIVGQAGAGKTSLRTKLMNAQTALPTEDKTTRGIDIEIHSFDFEGDPFDLRIWDFGGQNIQHYAHQFFLSDAVVYALVRDERKEDGGMSYWLNIISLLGKDSPVLIVQNEKQGHSEDIKELAAIRKAFPKVQEPIKINLLRVGEAGYRPFEDLRREICHLATKLPHVGRSVAASYKHLQDDLQAAAQGKQYIRLEEYEAICQRRGMTNRDTMYDFLRSYHQLGISLWFEQDLDLENYVFLKPKWIIDALFELLYDNNQRRQEAIIDTQSVKNIWRGDEYHRMHGTLLKLMRNFEMCYEMPDGQRYLIPQNQPAAENLPEQSSDATRVLFEYEFLPKGFLTRLICRQHHRIMEQNVWNNAVIFGEQGGATVLAYETYDQNIIELIAEGNGKAQLLNETISQLDAIHHDSKFKNLQVKKLVPCPCRICQVKDKPYYFNYEYIVKLTLIGEKEERCQESLIKVKFKDILKEIHIFSVTQIRDYLAADKIEDALSLLSNQFEDDKEIVLITIQLQQERRAFLKGEITREEYQTTKAKKIQLILELLN